MAQPLTEAQTTNSMKNALYDTAMVTPQTGPFHMSPKDIFRQSMEGKDHLRNLDRELIRKNIENNDRKAQFGYASLGKDALQEIYTEPEPTVGNAYQIFVARFKASFIDPQFSKNCDSIMRTIKERDNDVETFFRDLYRYAQNVDHYANEEARQTDVIRQVRQGTQNQKWRDKDDEANNGDGFTFAEGLAYAKQLTVKAARRKAVKQGLAMEEARVNLIQQDNKSAKVNKIGRGYGRGRGYRRGTGQRPYQNKPKCSNCNRHHFPNDRNDPCLAKDRECRSCGLTGHFQAVCRSSRGRSGQGNSQRRSYYGNSNSYGRNKYRGNSRRGKNYGRYGKVTEDHENQQDHDEGSEEELAQRFESHVKLARYSTSY